MTITVKINGNTASIALSGDIDHSTQEEFRAANEQALSVRQVKEIQIDLSEATFLDSAGIRALIILQKNAKESGKSVVILNCSENIRAVLETGGFDQLFTFQ